MSSLSLKEQLQALSLEAPTPSYPEKPKKKLKKPRSPDETIKHKPAWLEYSQYGVELLKAYFPNCFKEKKEVKPLKLGIKQDIVKRLSSNSEIVISDKACMVNSLAYYVNSISYHKKMIVGETRIDLEGLPAGAVTEEEAQYSSECRKTMLQKKANAISSNNKIHLAAENNK